MLSTLYSRSIPKSFSWGNLSYALPCLTKHVYMSQDMRAKLWSIVLWLTRRRQWVSSRFLSIISRHIFSRYVLYTFPWRPRRYASVKCSFSLCFPVYVDDHPVCQPLYALPEHQSTWHTPFSQITLFQLKAYEHFRSDFITACRFLHFQCFYNWEKFGWQWWYFSHRTALCVSYGVMYSEWVQKIFEILFPSAKDLYLIAESKPLFWCLIDPAIF